MNKHWLHFIGRQYYSPKAFIKEAGEFGFCRRVSAEVAKKMFWGNQILFAQKDKSGSRIFTSGLIIGIRTDVPLRDLEEEGIELDLTSADYKRETRGCGEIQTGLCASTNSTIPEVVKAAFKVRKDAKFFVTGNLAFLPGFKMPFYLKEIPFRMGFRELDFPKLEALYQASLSKGGIVRLTGQFYNWKYLELPENPLPGTVETIEDYRRF